MGGFLAGPTAAGKRAFVTQNIVTKWVSRGFRVWEPEGKTAGSARIYASVYRTAQTLSLGEYLRDHLLGNKEIEIFPGPERIQKLRVPLQERPVALLDDTAFRSCKSGVVVTENALFVLYDGRGVPLTTITDGPHFPQGAENAGYVGTTAGPFVVPSLGTDTSRAALRRLLEIVIAWNRGERSSPLEAFKAAGHVSQGVVSCLLPCPKVMPIWAVPDDKRVNARAFTRGMDHAAGERALALIDETTLGGCDYGVVVTDRQIHWRSDNPEKEISVPYNWLSGVGKGSSVFGETIYVHTHQARHELNLIASSEAIAPLGHFLGWLATLPPDARWQAPSPDEPPMPSIAYEARATSAQAGRELEPGHADDLVRRLDLLARNEHFGRGAREGMWQSPLSLADLRYALCAVLGEPLQRHWDGVTETLDFHLRRGGSGAGGALLSSAVGIALFATVGFGWVSVPKGPTITVVRFGLREGPTGSAYAVHGLAGHQYVASPALEDQIDAGLAGLEREVLRRRIAFGLAVDPRELGSYPREHVGARLHELLSRPAPAA